MANIREETRQAMLMPHLAAGLIMSLPHDKSSDGERVAEKKGDHSLILDTYHQSKNGRRLERMRWERQSL